LTQALGPHIRPDGRVLFFSTSLTSNPIAISPGYLPYVMCKGAVEQMARVLSRDPAFAASDRRITVNVVSPGPIETELFLAGKSQELLDRIASMHPSQRIGQPDEVRLTLARFAKHSLISAHRSGCQCGLISGIACSQLGARTEPAGQRRDGCLKLRSSVIMTSRVWNSSSAFTQPRRHTSQSPQLNHIRFSSCPKIQPTISFLYDYRATVHASFSSLTIPNKQIETDVGVERLNEVMQTVPADKLREINARLAAANPEFKRALALELVGVNAATGLIEPSYATCARCEEVYDAAEEREEGECVYHNGILRLYDGY
jgi:hypothetical protein